MRGFLVFWRGVFYGTQRFGICSLVVGAVLTGGEAFGQVLAAGDKYIVLSGGFSLAEPPQPGYSGASFWEVDPSKAIVWVHYGEQSGSNCSVRLETEPGGDPNTFVGGAWFLKSNFAPSNFNYSAPGGGGPGNPAPTAGDFKFVNFSVTQPSPGEQGFFKLHIDDGNAPFDVYFLDTVPGYSNVLFENNSMPPVPDTVHMGSSQGSAPNQTVNVCQVWLDGSWDASVGVPQPPSSDPAPPTAQEDGFLTGVEKIGSLNTSDSNGGPQHYLRNWLEDISSNVPLVTPQNAVVAIFPSLGSSLASDSTVNGMVPNDVLASIGDPKEWLGTITAEWTTKMTTVHTFCNTYNLRSLTADCFGMLLFAHGAMKLIELFI